MLLVGAVVIAAIDALPAFAGGGGSGWPPAQNFTRGPAPYLSLLKILSFWLIFLWWVRTTDWVSQDSQALKLRWQVWNPVIVFTFFLGLLLFWAIPVYAGGITVLLLSFAAPLITYIIIRNKQVTAAADKVLSGRHLKRWFARKVAVIGIKMEGADDDYKEAGPEITLIGMGAASDRDNSINLLTAKQSAGYLPARQLLDDAMRERATHIMLDYTAEKVGVRYQIDGVWHDRTEMDRDTGDAVLAVFKGIAALNIADRRSRQSGSFGMEIEKAKYRAKVASQGTQTGERALLQFVPLKSEFKSLDDLGMRAKIQEQIHAVFEQPGLIVFTALPGNGLTTTMDLVLSNVDRFKSNFVAVEDVAKPEVEIENVHVTTYSSAAGETPATVLPKLIRTYPDVIIVRDMAEQETLSILCEQTGENRLCITSIKAKEAVEALLRLMLLKVPPAELANAAVAVVNVRLVRKLCEKCKEAYPPPPEVLKQLGLPAGKVENLYRTPTQPIDPKHPDKVCDQCEGIGYRGRTAIFEMVLVDDTIRQVLTKAPKLENLRLAARRAKQRTLQEEGVLLVARGITSIQELARVLKQ